MDKLYSRWHEEPRKTILMAGASGFVGQALKAFLSSNRHSVLTLVRREPSNNREIFWDPEHGILDPHCFKGIDVVINLCGAGIADRRWTRERKRIIEESRILTTSLLARSIADLKTLPELFINASAVGFYGDTAGTAVSEESPSGTDFLAQVAVAWEAATAPLSNTTCRTVQARLSVVLNPSGGMLKKVLLPFKMGLGGRLGSGEQFISWIGLHDLLGIFEHIIYSRELQGPVNCVSPNPCTNSEFTDVLAQIVKRPALFHLPEKALKLTLGELSSLLLNSARVTPKKLLDSGYSFLFPDLAPAIRFEMDGLSLSALSHHKRNITTP